MREQLRRRDLLSDLPLDIIYNILEHIPIRDAVRTSLLSRQWRNVWASLPHLVFDKKCGNQPVETKSNKERLINFIKQALLLHKGPIYKFNLLLPSIPMSGLQLQSINQWLLELSKNDIRTLVLEFHDDDSGSNNLSNLYSCQNLTLLKLHMCTMPPPPPSFKGFLFLRSLEIRVFKVDSGTIESIVALSPLLEELKLATTLNSKGTRNPRIHAPNLKLFHFIHGSAPLSLCTPLLEELILNSASIKHFSFHGSSVFHHLKIIKLSDVPFNRKEARMAVDNLLKCSPNLQKLKISNLPAREDDAPKLACVSFCDTDSVPGFTYDCLKVIEMTFFSRGINEMKLIKFLLARSPVLERMICRPRAMHAFALSEKVLLNITAELLSSPRASASAEIVIDIKQEF